MENNQWKRVVELFESAGTRPEADRESWVRATCGPDGALFEEVRSLLDAAKAESRASLEPTPVDSVAGRRYGPWEAVRLLGTGGMGAVLLVKRVDGEFEQTAALKLVAPHLVGAYFLERFRAERQILAQLNHPNITKLLDGGVSEDGAPYLVMEFVDGLPMERYADTRALTIAQRLELFLKVCDAVEFAHRNLIVHRDLKPSNILVDQATGEPKLLDFGTARLLPESGAADTTITLHRLVTPRYASPEALRHAPITTQADVFSLGVLLYEQVTGTWPFGDAATPAEVIAKITAGAAEPPASRITNEVAEARSASVRDLKRVARGDLAKILKKATQPELNLRYRSVEEFAQDLRRYMAGEPVSAHPPSLLYQCRKFVRRHWIGVSSAAALVLALAAGIASTRQAQRRAERRFEEVRQLANYLVFDIHDGLQRLPGSTRLEKQVVERSLKYLDRLAEESADDASLRLELSAAYLRLGDVLGNPFLPSIGDRKTALEVYPRALSLADSVIAREPANIRARQLRATIQMRQGGTQFFGGDREAGKAQVTQALKELKSLLAESPNDVETRLEAAQGLTFLAGRLHDGGGFVGDVDATKIEQMYQQATDQLDQALRQHPGDVNALRLLAQNELSICVLWGSMDPAKAMIHSQAALSALDRLPAQASEDVGLRQLRGNILKNLGWEQGQLGRYPESLQTTTQAGEILQALAAIDPSNTTALYQMSAIYRNRGILRGYAKDVRGSIEDFENAADIHRRLSERDPANTNYSVLRGELLARLGGLYLSLGDQRAAREKTAAGLAIMKRLAISPKASPAQLMSACGWMVETPVLALRDASGAMPFCQRAVDLTEGKDVEAWIRLAGAQHLRGDRQTAITTLERVVAMLPPTVAGQPKSRQRQAVEGSLAEWKRASR